MKYSLMDVAQVIRSKNSGPYELTFDIIFKSEELYKKAVEAEVINSELLCRLYGIKESDIINIVKFTPANAIKATIVRPFASGELGETDVYGAQQHAPLLNVEFELS